MYISVKICTVILLGIALLNVEGPCNCKKNLCNSTQASVTSSISFSLKNKITGADILTATGPVPDSIKLRDLRTGYYYHLYSGYSGSDYRLLANDYNRASNIIDSVVFSFGSSVPDTLLIYTGLAEGLRGQDCPPVPQPAIVKAILRGQVILDTNNYIKPIPLKK